MLVSLKEIMEYTRKNGNAVGAFNCCNYESVAAVVGAAEELKLPVIISYAEVHKDIISIRDIVPVMLHFARKSCVPVCVHFDHGVSLESCVEAMKEGCTSVMIDASARSYEENIKITRQVVKLAHNMGITVEAELGHIFTSDMGMGKKKTYDEIESADNFQNINDIYTDPDIAKDFVEKTEVDVLAIAFGTSHGVYIKKPVLDLGRISKIKEKIDIPFVMHGGSGLSEEEYRQAIKNGIKKINYYTYMALAGGKAVKKAMDKKEKEENIFFHEIPLLAIQEMKENVKAAMKIFALQ
ncbi:class II fructose-bisphosphate aldolase [Mediterraneibacter sp. NSJ-55]|uniref:Class II fructose-bisphosphate aldolase n=1 Tax=Mediterraneibacter hominis TaxID=2763054 RepID=A0A923RQ42_9FIRM|nr:class II fructose-bisphosphate aldolase [Mediterraneibacter hominis]MBC5689130.1 class II fructose-bisphosphate aldolase [Mediterraneibacter hominis]